jgi:hypothetical protein
MIRPLTNKDQYGTPYRRPAEVGKAIDVATQQDIVTLRERAVVWKQDSPDFIPMECLVYIIREAGRRHEEQTMSVLLPPLLARCEAILKKKILDSDMPNAAEIRGEILAEFSVLFAEDGSRNNPDELDFFECRFNLAFRCFWIDFMRSETARTEQLVELPSETEAPDSLDDEERLPRVSDAFQKAATQLPDVFLQQLLNAIRRLPPDERKAVILCCAFGYKEESDDPAETTAASLCGVTGRTIRNRLHRAAAKLSKFKKEEA